VARGRQRIRQRGSRQQWAQARNYKTFGVEESNGTHAAPADGVGEGTDAVQKLLSGSDVIASTRCGLCNVVVEQRLRDGRKVNVLPYALCMSCDEVRCEACWSAEDDPCIDADEHEFMEVQGS
jgi:hypothetical protein